MTLGSMTNGWGYSLHVGDNYSYCAVCSRGMLFHRPCEDYKLIS